MKIIIPTKNRQETITTHLYFQNCDYYVLVHNQEQYEKYVSFLDTTKIDIDKIIVTNTKANPFGKTLQMEWACKNIVSENEIFIFADDNVKSVTGLIGNLYYSNNLDVQNPKNSFLKNEFEKQISVSDFINIICKDSTQKMDEIGANLCGFATVDNFFFRGNKWKTASWVIGKLMIWRNIKEWVFDHDISMDDFELTAQALLRDGITLVNAFAMPVAGHYESGGLGKKQERILYRNNDILLLEEKYPGLFLKKPGSFPDLKLRYHTSKQIENWRKQVNAIKDTKNIWRK